MNTTFNSYQAVLEHKDIPAGHVLVEDIQKNIKFEQPPTPPGRFTRFVARVGNWPVFSALFSNDTVLQAKQAKSGYDRKLQTFNSAALRATNGLREHIVKTKGENAGMVTKQFSAKPLTSRKVQQVSANLDKLEKLEKMQARNKLTRHGFLALSANEALLLANDAKVDQRGVVSGSKHSHLVDKDFNAAEFLEKYHQQALESVAAPKDEDPNKMFSSFSADLGRSNQSIGGKPLGKRSDIGQQFESFKSSFPTGQELLAAAVSRCMSQDGMNFHGGTLMQEIFGDGKMGQSEGGQLSANAEFLSDGKVKVTSVNQTTFTGIVSENWMEDLDQPMNSLVKVVYLITPSDQEGGQPTVDMLINECQVVLGL